MLATEIAAKTLSFYVNGEWTEAGNRDLHNVTNPATGASIAQVPFATAADVDRVVAICPRRFPHVAQRTGSRSRPSALPL